MRFAFLATFAATALIAQVAPRFEVVSIRVVPRDAPSRIVEVDFTPVLPGGRYIDSRTGLMFLIAFAYNLRTPDTQLKGLPNWTKDQSYSVSAKPAENFPMLPPDQNKEQVRLMVRSMLAERFHLQVHTETRQERVYQLEVAKGGLRIPEVEAPVAPAEEGLVQAAIGNVTGRMFGKRFTMAGLARTLTVFLRQPVLDGTGLKGYYDFDVHWRAPERPEGQPADGPGLGAEGIALLISNLQEQLGLRLTRKVGAVQYLVVDHLEPPTEN